MMVARVRPASPCWLTMPSTMTTKAPVGPPIWTREPPRSGDQEAGDNGGVEAPFGGDAAGDGKGDGQRERDDPDDHAGPQIAGKLAPGVPVGEDGEEFGLESGHLLGWKVARGLKISRRTARIAPPQVESGSRSKASVQTDFTPLYDPATLMGSGG